MDIGAFVQENRRWLIGCAIGGLLWWIGGAVVDSVWSAGAVRLPRMSLDTVYDDAALASAREQQQAVRVERERLEHELAFVPAPPYTEWNGSADQHLFQVGSDLRRAVVDGAGLRGVSVAADDVSWSTAEVGVDAIRRVLVGLDAIDAVQRRLFAAHDAARAADEDADGLQAILSIRLQPHARRTVRGRRPQRGEVDLDELLDAQQLTLHFQADEATVKGFLEACREPGRTLLVESFSQAGPSRPGELCTVKATLAAITFKS